MNTANKDAKKLLVEQFLNDFKATIANQRPYVIPRNKNLATLSELGLTFTDQHNTILQLSAEDYVSGPDPDHQRPGEVWVFGKQLLANEIYIKLKLVEYQPCDSTGRVKQPICLSFHITEQPLNYPLK